VEAIAVSSLEGIEVTLIRLAPRPALPGRLHRPAGAEAVESSLRDQTGYAARLAPLLARYDYLLKPSGPWNCSLQSRRGRRPVLLTRQMQVRAGEYTNYLD
jgi:hypothetical protein